MPATDKNKYRSVHDAVRKGDVTELERMVKAGASINEVDRSKDKFTPLHWACQVGALECTHWLLWHGADTTVSTPRGWTPAHIAAIRGQDACLQALANNAANLNARDHRGATPAHFAAAHGNSFCLTTMLRSGVDGNAADRSGWTPVHYASYHGRLGCLQVLVRWGGVVDECDENGNTPAHYAAMEGQLPCLKFLVSSGPSVTHILAARNDQGETPAMAAQQFQKLQVAEYIANVEWERDHPEEAQNLSFPAHFAAYQGDLDSLRLLIENGVVNLNERDDKGSTPLHKAAGQGHIAVVQWLLEMGANTDISNSAGETARDVARRFAQLACVRLLHKDGEDDEDATEGRAVGDPEVDFDFARPTPGDSEGEGLRFTEAQKKDSRMRAQSRMTELERQLELARQNFRQLGGRLQEEADSIRTERESERGSPIRERTITELRAELDYERLRREKMEAQLDQYRREVAYLQSQLEAVASSEQHEPEERMRRSGTRKNSKTRTRPSSASRDGVFVRRTPAKAKRAV